MSPSPSRFGIAFEQLEDRSLPSFGVPWADPGHMTLSFVPDGTAAPNGSSNLFSSLSSTGPASGWQLEILRAFQTWAVNANINIGLVADGGQALGTTGAVQGDSRFGDIRIGASALAADRIAFGSPFSWAGTTFAGDVLFNGAQKFTLKGGATGYDLFSVALHEAGHVFGLDHGDRDTVMNAGYLFSTGLSAGEIADLQALYGARTPDAFDLKAANGSRATASDLKKDAATGILAADADLTTLGDVDFYKFKASSSEATVHFQAKGLSLLRARVSVFDANGRLLASGSAADAFNNNVPLQLSGLTVNATYFIKVEGATADAFGVGAYRLTAEAGKNKAPRPLTTPPITDAHANDTRATATDLSMSQALAIDNRFDVTYRGSIEDAGDKDFYRLRVPKAADRGAVNLNVLVWATDGALDPRVRVFDASGNAVAFRVLTNSAGLMSVVVPNVAASGIYYVQVSARNAGATGGYVLAADFNQFAPPLVKEVGNGQLSPSAITTTSSLTVSGGIYQFALYAEALAPGAGGATLIVKDSAGKVVFVLNAASGEPAVTHAVPLSAGIYTFTFTYRPVSGQTAVAIRYHLGLMALSEGVGTYPPPTTTTMPAPTTTTTSTTMPAPMTGTYVAPAGDPYAPPMMPPPPMDFMMILAPLPTGTSTTTYTAPLTNAWPGMWYFF